MSYIGKKKPKKVKGFISFQDLIQQTNGLQNNSEEVKLYFCLRGSPILKDDPTIVFVHGLGGNHYNWDQQQRYFSQRYLTLSMDLRGFGRSSGPKSSPYNYGMYVSDLKRLFNELSIKSVIYIGGDLGAGIGVQLALDCPSLIEKLVLINFNPLYASNCLKKTLTPSTEEWEFAEYLTDELPIIWNKIRCEYDYFLEILRKTNFGMPSSPINTKEKKEIPSKEIVLKILGCDNPLSFIFEPLFESLSKLSQLKIPILLVVSNKSAKNIRGAMMYTYLSLIDSEPYFYQFLNDARIPIAEKDNMNFVLNNFIQQI